MNNIILIPISVSFIQLLWLANHRRRIQALTLQNIIKTQRVIELESQLENERLKLDALRRAYNHWGTDNLNYWVNDDDSFVDDEQY